LSGLCDCVFDFCKVIAVNDVLLILVENMSLALDRML